ncbi:MAG: 3-hydroxyacyl-ACP dehydratase FabZ [Verrucomicrobiota bacterium JB022]|nr:3-hydroxyacyl-ACP dehydratase FabZ [Verrucomicrobiota bacterium JB022]
MSLEAIYQTIPHRPPFLFVDEIVEVTDEGATARRTIRADEPQFEGHYPNNPIMPGVLLCESIFQTAAIYLAQKKISAEVESTSLTPVLVRIQDARFKRMVKPGDEITIEVTYLSQVQQFHQMRGRVLKDGKPAMMLECTLALIDESAAKKA